MADISGFDANVVEPNSFEVLPIGDYTVAITESEWADTKTGGKMVKLKLVVLDGQYKNRVLFDNLNLQNKSPTAVKIAQGTLSAICRAVGVMKPSDTSELHNKPLTASLGIQPAKGEYEASNKVKAYKKLEAVKNGESVDKKNPFAATA